MASLATSPPKRRVTAVALSTTSPRGGIGRRDSGSAVSDRLRARPVFDFGISWDMQRVTTPQSPDRERCSSRINSAPNTIISKLPERPSRLGRMFCSHCFDTMMTPAPRNAPHTWPAPPTTAMNR